MNLSPLPPAVEPLPIPPLRTVLAFLIVPIAAMVVLTIALMKVGPGGEQPAAVVIVFSFHLGYPVAFVLGVPTYAVLLWRGWDGWAAYLAAGAVLSIAAFCWDIASRGADSPELTQNILLLSLFIASGMIGALIFWLIVRPDRAARRARSMPSSV